MIVSLTKNEALFLLNLVGPHFVWPHYPHQDDIRLLPPEDRDEAGGITTRTKLIKAYNAAGDLPTSVVECDLTLAELWLFDEAMFGGVNYFKMDSEVKALVHKVWTCLGGYSVRLGQPDPQGNEAERQRLFLEQIDERFN